MGCASSAPLVQGGLDGAKQKAKQAAAEAEKIKDDAVDKMKVSLIRFTDAGETVKEKVIELKDEVEEKVSSMVSSGQESAEEAAKQAAEEATKEAEAAAKEAEEKVEEVTKEAEERIEKVTEEAKTTIDEAVKDAEKQDSRASTAGIHSDEGFPSAELADIRNEIEEDLKDMEDEPGTEEVERLESERLDLAEAGEEEREAANEAQNDKELEDILSIEKEMVEEENFRIQVGSEAEDAHGASQPPDPEENNNQKKSSEGNLSMTPVETA